MTTYQIQKELIHEIIKLPVLLRDQVMLESTHTMLEKLVMEIGDATRFASDPVTALRVTQHLFHTFLDSNNVAENGPLPF